MLQIHQQNESVYMAPFDGRPFIALRTVSFLSNQSLTGHALFGQPSKRIILTFQYGRKLKKIANGMTPKLSMNVTVQFRHCHEGFHLVPLTAVSILNFM